MLGSLLDHPGRARLPQFLAVTSMAERDVYSGWTDHVDCQRVPLFFRCAAIGLPAALLKACWSGRAGDDGIDTERNCPLVDRNPKDYNGCGIATQSGSFWDFPMYFLEKDEILWTCRPCRLSIKLIY